MDAMWARHAGTCGSRSRKRFVFVRKMMIARVRAVKFCWYSMPRSTVTKISNWRLLPRQEARHFAVQLILRNARFGNRGRERSCGSAHRYIRPAKAHLRTGEQKLLCFFQCCEGEFARDRGKSLEKILQRFSTFEVIKKRLDGDARPAKHGCSAENIRVLGDHFHSGNCSTRGKSSITPLTANCCRRLIEFLKMRWELLGLAWAKLLAAAGGMIARGIRLPANHQGAVQALTMRAFAWLLFPAPCHGEDSSTGCRFQDRSSCASTNKVPTETVAQALLPVPRSPTIRCFCASVTVIAAVVAVVVAVVAAAFRSGRLFCL